MRESGRHPHHSLVLFRQLDGRPLTKMGRPNPDIDRNIEQGSFCASHQLSLRVGFLIVQAPQHASRGA